MEKNTIPIIIAIFSIMLVLIPVHNVVYAQTIFYDVTVDNTGTALCDNVAQCSRNILNGEEITPTSALIGETINRIDIKITRPNNLPYLGDIVVAIWNSTIAPTSSNYLRLIDLVDVADVPITSDGIIYFNFTITPSYTFVGNEVIGIMYNQVEAKSANTRYATTDQFDGANTRWTIYSITTGWTDNNTRDLTMRLYFSNPTQGGIDCDLAENANILICRLGGTGAFGSAGTYIIGQAPTNDTDGTGLTGIGCGIGLVDCIADPDPKTNGLGLLIFIASIFIVVGMFVHTQGMQNTIKLPVYMWAIIIIALSAFFTLTQIIDPVFLIISIIGLIALAAPKLVNTFKGGSTFGSGSTE